MLFVLGLLWIWGGIVGQGVTKFRGVRFRLGEGSEEVEQLDVEGQVGIVVDEDVAGCDIFGSDDSGVVKVEVGGRRLLYRS